MASPFPESNEPWRKAMVGERGGPLIAVFMAE